MAIDTPTSQISDPFLLSILQTTASLREQTTALIELLNAQTSDATAQEPPRPTAEALKAQKNLVSHLAVLRGQNRRLAHLVRDTKATTSVSRAEVDRLHLGLQNLYYEQRHLVGEIAGCEEYPHSYKELPLIGEDEFLQRFPEWQTRKEGVEEGSVEQALMKARIAEERREREELEGQRAELLKKKSELVKANARRKEDLGNLDKDLEAFIEAAKPIQKTFEKEY